MSLDHQENKASFCCWFLIVIVCVFVGKKINKKNKKKKNEKQYPLVEVPTGQSKHWLARLVLENLPLSHSVQYPEPGIENVPNGLINWQNTIWQTLPKWSMGRKRGILLKMEEDKYNNIQKKHDSPVRHDHCHRKRRAWNILPTHCHKNEETYTSRCSIWYLILSTW